MDRNTYGGLRFERRSWPIHPRLIPIGLTLAVFTLLWWLVPASAMYWLILLLLAALVWMASYGWRQALAAIHDQLHRLEKSQMGGLR